MIPNEFKINLTMLLNKHSIDNVANTPDFILSEAICNFIALYSEANKRRDAWLGMHPGPENSLER